MPGPSKPVGLDADAHVSGIAPAVSRLEALALALRDHYAIRREIGRGGAAHVYLADDARTREQVALKVMRPELAAPVSEGRFRREIDIVRRLSHPHILPLLDFGAVAGQLYFTMPFVAGPTLRQRIRNEKQLRIAEALFIAKEVARALDYAHGCGVVHRDIKPENILLGEEGTLVADFGIAKAMVVAAGEEITPDSGIVIGTAQYMSPEQGEGHRELDGRSDIYALGCVVYEMLAGEPPFTGPTAQAIVARHCHELPRSIRVIRRTVPVGVERAIEKALAKVPADRFETAAAFVDALEEGLNARTDVFGFAKLTRRGRLGVTTGVVVVGALSAWWAVNGVDDYADPNRVVVFPLYDPGAPAPGDGEAVATFIGFGLEGTRPLKWLDGWALLKAAHAHIPARLDPSEARRVTRNARASFFIDGSILRGPDSVTVVLRLNSVRGDSVIRTSGRSAPVDRAFVPQLGLAAVGDLLPDLVATGTALDLGGLRDRRPTAVANFLQGERAYRRMRFREALPHYQTALRDDSALTIAALRGAYAANWLSDLSSASTFAEVALEHRQRLPLAQNLLARGLYAYLTGAADTAANYVRMALRSDSAVHAGLTILGEVLARMLPSEPNADSLARAALELARRNDPQFAPPLLLLWEMAVRRGDLNQVAELNAELQRAGADTTHAELRELVLRCVRNGPGSIDWPAAVRHDDNTVLFAGRLLGGAASQPSCAIAAYRAILETAGSGRNARHAALWGLQSLLAATNESSLMADVFRWPGLADLPPRVPQLALAAEGHGFDAEARAAAAAANESPRLPTAVLWAVGSWEAKQNNGARVRAIALALRRRADSTGARYDDLAVRAIAARAPLMNGDTAAAIAALTALAPTGDRSRIEWDPWESLGSERMLLARLLQANGNCAEAIRVASYLDATEPLTYPLFVRSSLELRARCATLLNDSRSVAHYERRVARLTSGSRATR